MVLKGFLLLIIFTLFGCGSMNSVIYEAGRADAIRDCEEHVDSHSRDCRTEHDKSYEEYKREREALLDEEKK